MSVQLVRAAAAVLGVAFAADPVTQWLFRTERTRVSAMTALLEPVAAAAVHVDQIEDQAASLWLEVPGPEPDVFATMTALSVEPGAEIRFAILNEAMEGVHPRVAHAYLAFVGVSPSAQGRGLGGELIRARLSDLDARAMPAYLEASSERSVPLYERLGFARFGAPLQVPEGPVLYPMWRTPRLSSVQEVL